MIFKCEKNKLAEALSNVQKSVSPKSTIPALEGILLSASEDKLKLCGYNMELGITTSIPASVEEEGKIVLNAHLFTEIVRKLPDDEIEVQISDDLSAKIISGKSNFELMGINADEFPSLPEVDGENFLELPVSCIKSMIKQTIFAVSENDSKPVHTGTLFDINDKILTLVSVDGYRLAI